MGEELGWVWNEAVVAYLILSHHFPRGTEKTHEEP